VNYTPDFRHYTSKRYECFGFCETDEICHEIVNKLQFEPLDYNRNLHEMKYHSYLKLPTRDKEHLIFKSLQEQLVRLKTNVDPRILKVHEAVYRATGQSCSLMYEKAFYDSTSIVDSVIEKRAAAVVAKEAGSISLYSTKNIIEKSPVFKDQYFEIFSGRIRKDLSKFQKAKEDMSISIIPEDLTLDAQLHLMKNWQIFFSNTGVNYDSLNETLDKLKEIMKTDI
jgi:predicted membrane GTPase involved in stress response